MPPTAATPALAIDEPELDRMLSALADGMLAEEDRERLEACLLENASARRRYLECMQMEFLLASEIGYGATGPAPVDHRPGSGGKATFLGGAAAALLIGLAAWALPGLWAKGWFASRPTATITAEQNAVWEEAGRPSMGNPIQAGPVRLLKGSAQITFASGAVVAIHAPASVEVLGGNRMFLRSGRVTPFVPPSAKGFTVVSPSGEVVDFGTEFSVAVDASGKTDVFVIGGEVDVQTGHEASARPVRLTQGFASRMSAAGDDPEFTQKPLVIDHFDSEEGPLQRLDFDADEASFVKNGRLWIPIDGRPHRRVPVVRTVLTNDFQSIVGRRSIISFKVTLPEIGRMYVGRWLGLVIDDGEGAPKEPHQEGAALALLMSPEWEAGLQISGKEPVDMPPFFARNEDRIGPYQAVMTLDDSPAAHAVHGSATVTVMINGLEVIRDQPCVVPPRPRFVFESYVHRVIGGHGYGIVDDFSVSIDAADVADSAAPKPL